MDRPYRSSSIDASPPLCFRHVFSKPPYCHLYTVRGRDEGITKHRGGKDPLFLIAAPI
jgi:hypothetical protein